MNTQQRLQHGLIALALAGFVAPVAARAQDDADARNKAVTLASEAIAAKEDGNLKVAKAKLEEVIALNPADDSAKELLSEVDKALLAQSEQPAKALSPLDKAAEANLNLFREIDAAMLDARSRAAKGDVEGANQLLDQAALALPQNSAAQGYRDRITLLKQDIAAGVTSRNQGGVESIAQKQIAEETRVSKEKVSDARKLISESRSLTGEKRYDDASAALDKAAALLPGNATADVARAELKKARVRLAEARYEQCVVVRDIKGAEKQVEAVELLSGKDDKRAKALRADLAAKKNDPHFKNIAEISPEFALREKKAEELLAKGRAQYLYGDYIGALETYKEVLQYQPYNTEAKALSIRIRETLHEKSGVYNKEVTKKKLLESVDNSWAMAEAFVKDKATAESNTTEDAVLTRMKGITLPEVTLKEVPLEVAVQTLSELALTYDREQKGVNMVLIDPEKKNPQVSLTMRNMPLNRVLEQVLRQVNYSFAINAGVVEVRPEAGNLEVETEFFPLAQGAVTRMTGAGAKASGGDAASPFGGGGGAADAESPHNAALKRYFRGVGMEFDDAKGYALQYDGTQLIVTHNRRTLERVRSILRRYSDVRQVAIETKFIEVNQGALNEIAANWTATNEVTRNGQKTIQTQAATGNRTLDSAFSRNSGGNPGSISTAGTPAYTTIVNGAQQQVDAVDPKLIADIPNSAPRVPGSANYGANNVAVFGSTTSYPGQFTTSFGIGGYDVNLFIQALEQTTGSDLMAAPSLTVKDATTATIKIAQLLRYPEGYGQIQSNVSNGGGNFNNGGGGGGGSVSITAGTPQDFVEKEVGVILDVTPTVAQDGESIELDLKPQIVEFEGFVEYGGTSVAVASGTVVTVPSGFYQPVFSIRKVETKVTVFDGATVVIGGLTREEVKSVHDKVPVLGDMPLIGKLFRSDGKTSSKRNLMVFVTANMISPTGAQLKGTVGNVRAGTTFQNPTLVSPSGSQYRAPIEATVAQPAAAAPAQPAPAPAAQ